MLFDNEFFESVISNGQRWLDEEPATVILVVAIVLAFLFILFKLFRYKPTELVYQSGSLARVTRGTRVLGYAVIVLFFGGFGTWAALAPLAGAAIASGVVSPEGSRKTIQHLEGGIIEAIHVREGDNVDTGTPLVTLRNTRALARYEELAERRNFLLALEARLTAEQLGASEIAFPEELSSGSNPKVDLTINTQRALFKDRSEVQQAREQIMQQRIAQLDEEISGLEEVIVSQNVQLDLIASEIDSTRELRSKGLARQSVLLELEREQAKITGEMALNKASIARNRQRIGETELQLLATRQQLKEEASTELAELRTELTAIESQLPERADTLARTVVFAPIAGKVLNVRVTTEAGGVIGSGEPILDIVPNDAALLIDARVRPQDIDTVLPGMRAQVVLTAFNQRYLPRIWGNVLTVSADRLVDEKTDVPYFLAKVAIDPGELDTISKDLKLVAGMPAEVMIYTGDRTLLDMLARPFSDSLRRSFRAEN